jgi:hypothetical protein
MKVFKEFRSLNRGEWGNIFTAMLIAAFVDIALWACGVLIGFGEGGTPTYYWVSVAVLGTLMTAILIGGSVWGSLDRCRMRVQPQHHTSAIPRELLLPRPR